MFLDDRDISLSRNIYSSLRRGVQGSYPQFKLTGVEHGESVSGYSSLGRKFFSYNSRDFLADKYNLETLISD